jgi:hypothetical protein
LPDPVHAVLQPAMQKKSQLPEPAHWRLQPSTQLIAQSPDEGQTQSAPLHSHVGPESGLPIAQSSSS